MLYEKNGYMHVQKISDPNTKWVGGGIPKSISTNGHLVNFVYPDGIRASIDTETFKRVPCPMPSGWKTVPSLTNMAYKTIAGDRVRVMDLMTGVISETPSSQNASGRSLSRRGLYYAITPTGLEEIYSVKTVWNVSLQSYDPVTKKWASHRS